MTLFDFLGQFVIFIIPGLLTFSLFCYLIGERPRAELMGVSYIFVASIFSFEIGNLIIYLINLLMSKKIKYIAVSEMLSGINNSLSTVGMLVSCVSAILLAIIVAYLWENNIIFLVARKLRLSHKVNNLEVWQCLFDEQPWVIVRDYISENVYYGKVIQYSDSSDMRELLLSEVRVWSKKDGEYTMEKVYLARQCSEFSIEIDDYTKEAYNE